MTESNTQQYTVPEACQSLLDVIGLSRDDAIAAFEQRQDTMLVPSVPTLMYALKWVNDGEAIFTAIEMTRMEWQVDRARPAEITLQLALRLRPDLPAGTIASTLFIDQNWSRIADSFGVPVTCHEKLARSTRYTGRWDGDPPRYTASEGDTVIVVGGLDRERNDAKYLWALSRNKYLDWYRGTSTDASAAPDAASLPRLVFARMQPPVLKQPVMVRADIGEAAVRLLCNRCGIVEIDDPPHFHPPIRCIFLYGMEMLDGQPIPRQVQGKEYIIPLHYVTDIRPGPAAFFVGDQAPQRSAVLPNDFRPGHKMSQRAIESLLAELTPS